MDFYEKFVVAQVVKTFCAFVERRGFVTMFTKYCNSLLVKILPLTVKSHPLPLVLNFTDGEGFSCVRKK